MGKNSTCGSKHRQEDQLRVMHIAFIIRRDSLAVPKYRRLPYFRYSGGLVRAASALAAGDGLLPTHSQVTEKVRSLPLPFRQMHLHFQFEFAR